MWLQGRKWKGGRGGNCPPPHTHTHFFEATYAHGVGFKEGCNWGHALSGAIKLGTPEPKFLQSGGKVQPVKQNLCLAPDQKMILPKKVANGIKINLAP